MTARVLPVLVASAALALSVGAGAAGTPPQAAAAPRVTLNHPTGQARIDVLVDGKPFTSYIWPGSLKKPSGNGRSRPT